VVTGGDGFSLYRRLARARSADLLEGGQWDKEGTHAYTYDVHNLQTRHMRHQASPGVTMRHQLRITLN
jgi:hypothetical protein